jgi:hypothetical protein
MNKNATQSEAKIQKSSNLVMKIRAGNKPFNYEPVPADYHSVVKQHLPMVVLSNGA